jgi:membrane-associated phospholipid phosphatase
MAEPPRFPISRQPSRTQSSNFAARLRHDDSSLGTSPGSSNLVAHSLPHNLIQRDELQAMQDAYSFNPQLESDYVAVGSRKTMSMLGGGGSGPMSIRPLGSSAGSSRFAQPNENYFASPGSTPSSRQTMQESYFGAPSPIQPSTMAAARTTSPPQEIFSPTTRGRVDPTPLLANEPSTDREETLAQSLSSALPPASDPHKPLRRWLYDFPPRINDFFARFDSTITRTIQWPLATVGGLTNSLEEEILQSNEMASQARQEVESQRMATGRGRRGDMRSQSLGHLVPLKSMAITRRNKVLVALALLYTSLTTIELGVFGAVFLFLSGYDEIGTLHLLVTSFAALSSQVFKRFVWRARPWMQNRAIVVKRDKTSSFPSRAVLCAAVYAYSFCHLFWQEPHTLPLWFWPPFVLLFSLGAGISRIFVGAHFASDCLAGFVLGLLGCLFGTLVNDVFQDVCGSCYYRECYAQRLDESLAFSDFPQLNMLAMGLVSGISIVCVGLAMSSPLHFWQKATNVFGILFPCFAFRLVLLCPSHAGGLALQRVDSHVSAGFIVVCLLLAAGLLIFTKLLSKLTVIETTVQLSTESGSGGSGEESLFSGIEPSLLQSRSDNEQSTNRSARDLSDPAYDQESEREASQPPVSTMRHPSVSRSGRLGHTEESTRRFLQRSSVAGMIWNLLVYALAFCVVFFTLMLTRCFLLRVL